MNLRKIFHMHGTRGWCNSDTFYAKVIPAGIDGIGTEHARCVAKCDDCGEEYYVCSIHLPDTWGQRMEIKRLKEEVSELKKKLEDISCHPHYDTLEI